MGLKFRRKTVRNFEVPFLFWVDLISKAMMVMLINGARVRSWTKEMAKLMAQFLFQDKLSC